LSKQLQIKDIFAVAIEPPRPWQPRYELWKKEFERFDVGPETVLIGHSCGGGFLVLWLSENHDRRVGNVVLVAPWLNPENDPESDTDDFFVFKIDPDLVRRTARMTLFNSDNDSNTIHKSVSQIRSQIKDIDYVEFHHYGHFCLEDMRTVKSPELLEAALN
jgi:predicted alpha/beta hydrolase family esterase